MSLAELWFVVVAVFWVGFFVLEGFDFGVGALHSFLARDEGERRQAIEAIGPVWDGNEVWLIVGGAAIFAAFPDWYATWFSAGYLALMLVIVALIVRGVSFEWRTKLESGRWRRTFSAMLTIGSAFVPLLLGVALGDLLAGLPVDSSGEFTGDFVDLLTPYGVLVGVTLLVLCLVHGATFLALKTRGGLQQRAHAFARRSVWPAVVLTVVFAVWTVTISAAGPWRIAAAAVPALAAVAAAVLLRGERDGRSFAATAVTVGGVVAALFANVYPAVLVSSTSSANDLTVSGAASGHYALTVMTVVAAVMFPVVLLYQGWTYWVFRHRVAAPAEVRAATSGRAPAADQL